MVPEAEIARLGKQTLNVSGNLRVPVGPRRNGLGVTLRCKIPYRPLPRERDLLPILKFEQIARIY